MKPSDFLKTPYGSKFRDEYETVRAGMIEGAALRIMEILASTGDEWRLLQWDEYKSKCKKEGIFCPPDMRPSFDQALAFTQSPTVAKMFSPVWAGKTECGMCARWTKNGELCNDCMEATN